jgi:hypothetical protein
MFMDNIPRDSRLVEAVVAGAPAQLKRFTLTPKQ